MKIAIIKKKYYLNNNDIYTRGALTYLFNVIKSLALNNEVDILCCETDVENNKLFHKAIIFKNINDVTNDYLKKNGYQYVWVLEQGIEITSVYKFDFFHSHSKIYRHKFVRRSYELLIQSIFDRKRFFSKDKIEEYKKNFPKFDVYFVNSELQKWDYVNLVGLNESAVYKLTPLIESIDENIQRKKSNIFTFGVSALSFDSKGGFLFLTALSKLKKKNKNFRAKIIYPKYKNNLIVKIYVKFKRLSKYVEFLDFQNDMQDFYNSIDCLVMPSREETFGLVALESMKNKIPVVVSNLSGASEIINDGENGFIFEIKQNATNNLFNVLFNVLKCENLDLIVNNAFETVKQYTMVNHSRKLTKILEEFYSKNKEVV